MENENLASCHFFKRKKQQHKNVAGQVNLLYCMLHILRCDYISCAARMRVSFSVLIRLSDVVWEKKENSPCMKLRTTVCGLL